MLTDAANWLLKIQRGLLIIVCTYNVKILHVPHFFFSVSFGFCFSKIKAEKSSKCRKKLNIFWDNL